MNILFYKRYLLTSTFENSKLVTLTYFLNSFVYKKVGQKCTNFLDFMDLPSQTYMKWPLVTALLTLVCREGAVFPTVIPRPFWYQCHATDLLFHKRKVFTIILHDARSLIVICLFGFSHVRSTLGWLHPVFPYVYSSLRFTLIRVGIGWRTEGMS